jgi:hypothetical protein
VVRRIGRIAVDVTPYSLELTAVATLAAGALLDLPVMALAQRAQIIEPIGATGPTCLDVVDDCRELAAAWHNASMAITRQHRSP